MTNRLPKLKLCNLDELEFYQDDEKQSYMTTSQLTSALNMVSNYSVNNIVEKNYFVRGEEFSKTFSAKTEKGTFSRVRAFNIFGIRIILLLSKLFHSKQAHSKLTPIVGKSEYEIPKNREESSLQILETVFKRKVFLASKDSFMKSPHIREYYKDLSFLENRIIVKPESGISHYCYKNEVEEAHFKNKGITYIKFNPNIVGFEIEQVITKILEVINH